MRTLPKSILATTVMATTFSLGTTAAVGSSAGTPTTAAISSQADAPAPTPEQIDFVESLDVSALAEIDEAIAAHGSDGPSTMAFPIAAAAIAAAAWCAKGALASVPTSVIDDVANGGEGTSYVRNAIIGCLGGEIGGVVWKFLPGWVKKKAVEMVAAFIIKYIR